MISTSIWTVPLVALLFIIHQCYSTRNFGCLRAGDGSMPSLPQAFSTNIRINFLSDQYTTEVKYATNEREKKEIIEFKTANRRVQYILRGDQKCVLVIYYKKDEHPSCVVRKSLNLMEVVDSDDAGEDEIILKTANVLIRTDRFYPFGPSYENGILTKEWEGCFTDPKINVSFSFEAEDWRHSHISYIAKDVDYPVKVTAQIGKIFVAALYSNFDPSTPDDKLFQPPEDVYCDGFRTDKSPPPMPNYFSYNAEIIVYESAVGLSPIVSHRKVYYDYSSGISRTDFYDPLVEGTDMFSGITAQEKSIIHDFNAGVQYSFDPFTGKCTQDTFQSTFNVISSEETKDNVMLQGNEYFWLDNAKLSYNGQFPVRGMMADVYTYKRIDPKTKKSFVISYYFSTEETRVVENENVEKNVLLRMKVRPETDLDKKGVVVIDFFNFAKEEPNVFTYDLRSCYNESTSKLLVLTFPAFDSLKGSEKLTGMLIHLTIKDVTGIRKQRIFMNEVVFSGQYMYAEFVLLEVSPFYQSNSKKQKEETTLDSALRKLKDAISAGNFTVNVPSGKETVVLRPEPNGLNIFAGDRIRKPSVIGYRQDSVIFLTLGMLFLGVLLGGVTLNLIMSKKFGVSLFQKSRYGNEPFDNPVNESSM